MTCGFNCNKTGVVCLRHQSVTLFLLAYPLLRNVLARRCEVFPFDFLCSGCFIFKMSLVLNTVTLLIGDDTIYRPCHFSILYYQELWAVGTTMPTTVLPYMSECFLNFWEGAGKREHTRRTGAGNSFLRFIVDCIHYLSFHWLRTLELILEISATYRTDLPVLCKQIID